MVIGMCMRRGSDIILYRNHNITCKMVMVNMLLLNLDSYAFTVFLILCSLSLILVAQFQTAVRTCPGNTFDEYLELTLCVH